MLTPFIRFSRSSFLWVSALAGVVVLSTVILGLGVLTDAAYGTQDSRPDRIEQSAQVVSTHPTMRSTMGPSTEEILSQTRQSGIRSAISQLEAVQKNDPSNIQVANQLAVLWAAAGDLDRSREALEYALANHPDAAVAFLNLRELAGQQFAEAYAKAIGQNPPSEKLSLQASGLELAAVKTAAQSFEIAESQRRAAQEAAARQEAERVAAEQRALSAQQVAQAGTASGAANRSRSAPGRNKVAVEQMLEDWAKAWANKDFNRYADFYSKAFSQDKFKTRQQWLDFRRPRIIGKADIVVELSAINVEFQSDDRARASFSQRYESGNLRLNTRKRVSLVYEDGLWRISSEGN